MAIIKVKPTSPGRRGLQKVVTEGLHKGKPHAPLLEKKIRGSGRNHHGRITVRHHGIPATVERIEYDPNRSAHLALLCYADGERTYIIAPKGVAAGEQLLSGIDAPFKTGNAMPLKNIPVGSTIHCIELRPGKGAQMARSAGTSVQLLAKEGAYAQLRLRSGEVRKVHLDCKATLGAVGNDEHSLRSIGKAGAMRWRGVRPTVRGVVMNSVDHPHGGGEGRTSGGRHPVSPWGQPTKGYRTRNNKRTDNMRVSRRPSNKR
jgi:large subunit ribosomal protein L2